MADRDLFYHNLRASNAKRYKTFDRLSVEVWFNMIQTFVMGETRMAARVQNAGLTLPGLNVLSILRQHGSSGCPLNTISSFLLVSRANITGLVDSLARKGFVIRQPHAHDRRVILAKITPEGEAWMNAYLPQHYAEIHHMFSGLTKQEKQKLNELLTKLRKAGFFLPRQVSKS